MNAVCVCVFAFVHASMSVCECMLCAHARMHVNGLHVYWVLPQQRAQHMVPAYNGWPGPACSKFISCSHSRAMGGHTHT